MVGVLVVSHSSDAARGIAEIAREVAGGGDIPVVGVGGNESGGLGVSIPNVLEALTDLLARCEGVLIVPDIGSSILSSRGAIGMLPDDEASRVAIANAPTLEGAMVAVIEASGGAGLAAVAEAAAEAKNLDKSEH